MKRSYLSRNFASTGLFDRPVEPVDDPAIFYRPREISSTVSTASTVSNAVDELALSVDAQYPIYFMQKIIKKQATYKNPVDAVEAVDARISCFYNIYSDIYFAGCLSLHNDDKGAARL